MKVGLYDFKVRETPDRGELKFYRPIGEAEIPEFVPEIKAVAQDEKEYDFVFDKVFSKEIGHYAYVKTDKSTLTPFNPDSFDSSDASNSKEGSINKDKHSGSGESGTD